MNDPLLALLAFGPAKPPAPKARPSYGLLLDAAGCGAASLDDAEDA